VRRSIYSPQNSTAATAENVDFARRVQINIAYRADSRLATSQGLERSANIKITMSYQSLTERKGVWATVHGAPATKIALTGAAVIGY
jgi:hypothetical protein